jgi:hypothetical protein
MKNRKLIPFWILTVAALVGLSPRLAVAQNADNALPTLTGPTKSTNMTKIRIKVGKKAFTATLEDTATGKAFKALLPMSADMTELNGNEKYFRLSAHLPTDASNPGTIQTGDLMIYGQNTLVLFYETFSTTYTYTRLGHIEDPHGLAAALGAGNVTISYELNEKPKRDEL